MEAKTCTSCGLELPLACYNKNSMARGGLTPSCKDCISVKYKARYLADTEFRERAKAKSIAQRLADPAAIKAYKDAYYIANHSQLMETKRKYYEANKAILIPKMKAYIAENRDKANAANARWQAKNPDIKRATKMRRRMNHGDYITAPIIEALWHKQKGQCVYCRTKLGESPKAKQAYHVDHVHPLSKGGTNEVHNLQRLCPPCNLKKGAKLPHVFAQQLGRLF